MISSLRRPLRSLLEAAAVRSGATALARRQFRHRIAIIAYHNVVPEDQVARGDASLHLSLDRFVRQIDRITRTHEIVDLRSVAEVRSADRPRAVITFDDAYRGAVNLALPELRKRGVPAAVFASPGLLGSDGTWWDELAEAGRLTEETRSTALQELRGDGRVVRSKFQLDIAPALPPSYGIAELDELLVRAGDGISVGSHAWAHEHLPSLPENELQDSLRRTLDWVRGLGPDIACPWLALPYGAGSPELGARATDLGYDGVLRIEGGLWKPERDRGFVPRINVPAGLTAGGLELRMSGIR